MFSCSNTPEGYDTFPSLTMAYCGSIMWRKERIFKITLNFRWFCQAIPLSPSLRTDVIVPRCSILAAYLYCGGSFKQNSDLTDSGGVWALAFQTALAVILMCSYGEKLCFSLSLSSSNFTVPQTDLKGLQHTGCWVPVSEFLVHWVWGGAHASRTTVLNQKTFKVHYWPFRRYL